MFDKNDKQTQRLADLLIGSRMMNEDEASDWIVKLVFESPVALSVNDIVERMGSYGAYSDAPVYMSLGHTAFSLKHKGILHLVEAQPVKWLITKEMIDFCNEKRDRGNGHRTFVLAQFQSLEDVDFAGQVNSDLPSAVSTIEVAIIRYLLRAKEASVSQLASDINSDCRWVASYQRYRIALDQLVKKGYVSRLHAKHDPYYLISPVFEQFIELQKDKTKMSKSNYDEEVKKDNEALAAKIGNSATGPMSMEHVVVEVLYQIPEGQRCTGFNFEPSSSSDEENEERLRQLHNAVNHLHRTGVVAIWSENGKSEYALTADFRKLGDQKQAERDSKNAKVELEQKSGDRPWFDPNTDENQKFVKEMFGEIFLLVTDLRVQILRKVHDGENAIRFSTLVKNFTIDFNSDIADPVKHAVKYLTEQGWLDTVWENNEASIAMSQGAQKFIHEYTRHRGEFSDSHGLNASLANCFVYGTSDKDERSREEYILAGYLSPGKSISEEQLAKFYVSTNNPLIKFVKLTEELLRRNVISYSLDRAESKWYYLTDEFVAMIQARGVPGRPYWGIVTPEMVGLALDPNSEAKFFNANPEIMSLSMHVCGKRLDMAEVRHLYRCLTAFVDMYEDTPDDFSIGLRMHGVDFDHGKAKSVIEHIEFYGIAAFDPKS